MTHAVVVDLDRPPEQRWECLAPWKDEARAMIGFYLKDIGSLGGFDALLDDYCASYVDADIMAEIRGAARALDVSEREIVLTNLYYDAMKLVLSSPIGCTAFAIDTPGGPLLARNLDWTTANGRLASDTMVATFVRRGEVRFRTVGWPGFVGALSGVAPGRFAVTLNAVISDDPPTLEMPVAFLLRRVLETAESFDEAVAALRDTPVASDSLLLVSGTKPGEMVVIERSPTRSAVRYPHDGFVVVTNEYRALASGSEMGSTLGETSCGRFDRARAMVRASPPRDATACLDVLRDSRVKMGITVQHMVLSAATGDAVVALPR